MHKLVALIDAYGRADVKWRHAQWEPGLQAAQRRAKGGGRRPKLTGRKKTTARALYFDLFISLEEIDEHSGVARTTTARREGKKAWTPRKKRRRARPG